MIHRQQFNTKPNFVRPILLCHPNIPKPMHGVSPREIMGKEWWDEQRVKVYKFNNYCCFACGVHKSQAKKHKWLEAHEIYNINYSKGRMVFSEIAGLCHYCHNFIHDGRLKKLRDAGQITIKEYEEIIKHGRDIIKANNLVSEYRRTDSSGERCLKWEMWRMIFNGKEYPPKYKSYEDWLDKFEI